MDEIDNFLHDEPDFDDYRYLQTNELHFNENRARDIEGVLLRIEKFTDRGMTISEKTKRKIKQRTTKKKVREYKKAYDAAHGSGGCGGRRSYYG